MEICETFLLEVILLNKFGSIYIIENTINGKQYVGQTITSLKRRFLKHCNDKTNTAIHGAIVKYGRENFTIREIDVAYSREELNEKEVFYIKQMNSKFPNGYNLTDGGEGVSGHKFSDESRKKLSESHKGYNMPQEQRDNIAKANRKPKTKEHAENISKGLKEFHKTKKVWTEEERIRRSEAQKGKRHTQETKDKISQKNKGRKLSEEEYLNYRARVDAKLKKVKNLDTGEVFNNVNVASELFENKNSAKKGIRRVCAGARKTFGGYRWEYC